MDSDTSDSGDDLERHDELKRRQREFAAKRAFRASAAQPAPSDGVAEHPAEEGSTVRPLCCQLLVEDDYDEHLDLAGAFRERGFVVVGADMLPLPGHAPEKEDGPFVPDVQWCSYKKVAWSAVLKGQVDSTHRRISAAQAPQCGGSILRKSVEPFLPVQAIANHYFLRSGLVRKAELVDTLAPFFPHTLPEGCAVKVDATEARAAFAEKLRRSAAGGGLWILKPGDSSNATDISVFDAAAVERVCSAVLASQRASWVLQRYIERPLLARGRKFHLRATVLATGRLQVFLHRHVVALLASRPYTLDCLDDMQVHTSNHSVQARAGGACEALLLPDLASAADALPPISQRDDDAGAAPLAPGVERAWLQPEGAREGSATDDSPAGRWSAAVWAALRELVFRVFASAVSAPAAWRVFRPLPCAFELFGLDAMVDADGRVVLLELNCDPDLAVRPSQQVSTFCLVPASLAAGTILLDEKSPLPTAPTPVALRKGADHVGSSH